MLNLKMVLILLLVNTYQVNAIGITANTNGGFLINGSSEVESSVQWGESIIPSFLGGEQSSLAMIGINSFPMHNNQPFKVAELTYKNTDIKTDTSFSLSFSSVALAMTLNYGDSNSSGSYDFSAGIEVIETSNGGGDTDDRVSVIFDNSVSSVFSINETDYVFELLGFSNSESGFDQFFIQPEGSSSSADLYAKITAVPVPSALWLFMTALSGFIMTGNRKR